MQDLLALPDRERAAHLVTFYETLEGVMDGLYNNNCAGFLTLSEKQGIFRAVRDDWSDENPDFLRASMIITLNMLQPLEGISEWLLGLADRQHDKSYAEYLRDCATRKRTTPAV